MCLLATSTSSDLADSMFRPRRDERRMFAGRPKGDKEVPSLITLCVRVLCANIDGLFL